jgi:hypothetical protein
MTFKTTLGVAVAALAFSAAAFAQDAAKPARIRGEIVAFSGDQLTVHRRSGDTVVIGVKPDLPVAALRSITLADVKPGSFIGTAAATGTDGRLMAREVVVFPEAMRGTGEGHYAWDLEGNSTMTNANVDSVVQGTSGRDLKLSYKGGTNSVTVPQNVPVVTIIAATHADIQAGKKVFVVATPSGDGKYQAQRMIIEKDGVAPPM